MTSKSSIFLEGYVYKCHVEFEAPKMPRIETTKMSRGGEWGEGILLPSRL